jgi:hypothetical protein
MGSSKKKYIPKKTNFFPIALHEKHLIEKHYSCFKCIVDKIGLTCNGYIQPDEESIKYKVQIKYQGGAPKVFIRSPKIDYNSKIHVYDDKSLCLYYPKEDPWNNKKHLYDTIIPWVSEWLVYYELFLLTGKWLGPEQTHGSKKIKDK